MTKRMLPVLTTERWHSISKNPYGQW